jgi:hypothetical protein
MVKCRVRSASLGLFDSIFGSSRPERKNPTITQKTCYCKARSEMLALSSHGIRRLLSSVVAAIAADIAMGHKTGILKPR